MARLASFGPAGLLAQAPCSGNRLVKPPSRRQPHTERGTEASQRRQRCLNYRLPIDSGTQTEGPLKELAEFFGATGGDPGHWNLSPEWWGNQGGGWGRDAGGTVFESHSQCGNGRVTVTAHAATPQGSPGAAEPGWEEWRVLRFNNVTRQSVARVRVEPTGGAMGSTVSVLPDCLAQDYLKTTAAVTAALLGLLSLNSRAAAASGTAPPLRVLCIGVGGGSLPLFLTHHFPGAVVDAVELDPAVVAAATTAMGLRDHPRLRLHTLDAAAFLSERHARQQQAGVQQQAGQQQGGQQQDEQVQPNQRQVSPHERGRLHSQAVLQAEHQLHQTRQHLPHQQHRQHSQAELQTLHQHGQHSQGPQHPHRQHHDHHPEQGQAQGQQAVAPYDIVIMDAFDGADDVPATLCTPEFARLVAGALHPQHGCFLLNMHSIVDESTISGFKSALLGTDGNSGSSNSTTGSFFAVRSRKQLNQCIVGARGLQLPAGGEAQALRRAAADVAAAAGYRFPAGSRSCNAYQAL